MSRLPSTQEHLDIVDIIDRYVILKTGACAIVQPAPVNFDLLSEREQDSIINTFAGFLNSLTFPIQVVVHTRRTDLTEYINRVEGLSRQQTNEFLKTQIDNYRDYIDRLASRKDILDKKFYVVVPHYDTTLAQASRQAGKKPTRHLNIKAILERAKDHLDPKIDHIASQLSRFGIKVKILEEEDLVQLFYTIYNPTTSKLEHLTLKVSDYSSPLVESEIR